MAGSIWQVNTAIKALFTSPLEYKCEIYVCILYIVNSDGDGDEKNVNDRLPLQGFCPSRRRSSYHSKMCIVPHNTTEAPAGIRRQYSP